VFLRQQSYTGDPCYTVSCQCQSHSQPKSSPLPNTRSLYPGLASFCAAATFGYDSVTNGASLSMPSFFIYFGELGPTGYFLPAMWTSLWVSWDSSPTRSHDAFQVHLLIAVTLERVFLPCAGHRSIRRWLHHRSIRAEMARRNMLSPHNYRHCSTVYGCHERCSIGR
jgi:hypothetical protein